MLRALAADPDLFDRLLAVHARSAPVSEVGLAGALRLAWRLASAWPPAPTLASIGSSIGCSPGRGCGARRLGAARPGGRAARRRSGSRPTTRRRSSSSRARAALARYRQLEAAFGSSEQLRLVASGDGLWTRAGLTWLAEVEARAAEAPWALGAIGLAGHHRSLGLPWPPEDPEAFRRRARENRLDRELGLAGGDGGAAAEVATVLVSIEPPDKAAEAESVAALERLVAEPPPGVSARAAGLPVLDLALDASSREIVHVFFPILVGLAVALLGLSFRDLRGVALPLLFVAAPEVVLLGALGSLGVTLNLVLAVLPPLLFVIALATAVHLQVRFRDALEDGLRGAEAVRATYEDKGWAVLWTGITTMVGFGSLVVSRVGPIPHLGLASAVGIGLILLAAFTLLPALFAVAGAPARGIPGLSRPRAFERRFRRLGRAWAEWAADRRLWVIAAAAVALAVALAGLPRLQVESDAVRFLPVGHPARVGIERLEAAGVGGGRRRALPHASCRRGRRRLPPGGACAGRTGCSPWAGSPSASGASRGCWAPSGPATCWPRRRRACRPRCGSSRWRPLSPWARSPGTPGADSSCAGSSPRTAVPRASPSSFRPPGTARWTRPSPAPRSSRAKPSPAPAPT